MAKYTSVSSLKDVKEPIALAKQLYADGARCYYGFNSFDDVEDFVLHNKKASLHEVTRCGVRGIQRLFLDIDAKYDDFKDVTKEQIKKAYDLLLQSVFEVVHFNAVKQNKTEINDDAFYLDGCRDDKFSMHVIYKNIYIDGEHINCFCRDVMMIFAFNLEMEKLPASLAKIIDSGVYGRNHCVRIHTSRKFGTQHRLIIKDEPYAAFNKETLITYRPYDIRGIQYYKCPDGCAGINALKPTTELNNSTLQAIEKCIDELKPFGITVARMDKQYPRLLIDHTLPCYVCGNKHDSENLMCVIDENTVKLICRRQPQGSKKRFKIVMQHSKYNIDKSAVDKPHPLITNKITISQRVPSISREIGSKWINLIIKAIMGAGKTHQISEFVAEQIRNNPNFRVIVPTYRRGLANALAVALSMFMPPDSKPFECYENIVGKTINVSEHKLLTIQYESLHRLQLSDDTIDLVIIDEAKSFAQQTLSRLNENKNGLNQLMLRNLLANSKQNMLVDALMDEPTIDVYKQYLQNKELFIWEIQPETQWNANIKIHKDATRWRDSLMKDLKEGNKIYMSTTIGEDWIKTTRKLILVAKPDVKILMVYGGLEDNSRIISNINAEFTKYDVVIASPCISSGVSFDVEGHFDKIYVYVDNSGPNAVDVIQSLRRVRHPKTKEVVICDATRTYWLPTTFEDVKKHAQNRLRINKNDFIHDGIELIMNGPNYEFANDCSPQLLFKLYCMRLHNLNSMDIFGTLMEFLKENGCEITEEVPKYEAGTQEAEQAKKEKKTFKDDKKQIQQMNYEEIAKARVISSEEYEDLSKKLSYSRRTYREITNEDTNNLSIIRKFLDKDYEDAQLKKFRLLRHYGLHEANGSIKQSIFNTKEGVEKYSNEDVMYCYREMAYRDLPIEFIEKIDAARTVNMNDDDKLNYHYLSGRHAIISKIRELFKNGDTEYQPLLDYIKNLYKNNIPGFERCKEPTNHNLKDMINKLIKPYGFKVCSRRVGNKEKRKRVLFIKDCAAELFEIIVLPYDSDIITKNMTIQMGQNKKPTVLVYIV